MSTRKKKRTKRKRKTRREGVKNETEILCIILVQHTNPPPRRTTDIIMKTILLEWYCDIIFNCRYFWQYVRPWHYPRSARSAVVCGSTRQQQAANQAAYYPHTRHYVYMTRRDKRAHPEGRIFQADILDKASLWKYPVEIFQHHSGFGCLCSSTNSLGDINCLAIFVFLRATYVRYI